MVQAQADLQEATSLIQQAATTTDPVQQQQLLAQAAELQTSALAALPEIEVTATATDTVTTSVSSLEQALSSATSSEAIAAIQNIQSQLPQSASTVTVTRELTSYTISNKETTDVTVDKTKVVLVLTVTTAMQNVTIVETIPKSVAMDISLVLFPGAIPTILQADPIVSWTFSSVEPGDTKDMSYVVTGKVVSLESTTVAGGSKPAAAPTPKPTPTPIVPTPVPVPVTEKQDYSGLIIVGALIVIVAIAVVALRGRKFGGGKKWGSYKAK
jgi:hypothetical protein